MGSLGPGECVPIIDPDGETHQDHSNINGHSVKLWMIPVDKEARKNKEKKAPEPVEDLPKEWAKEDVEIEGRKPDLGEIEDDASEI